MDFQEITDFAKEILLEVGECRPTVFVEVEGGQPYILPFMNFPFRDTSEREFGLFVAARRFARKARKQIKGKKIIHLAFACEGWGAQMQKTEKYVGIAHVARQAVVLCSCILPRRSYPCQSRQVRLYCLKSKFVWD